MCSNNRITYPFFFHCLKRNFLEHHKVRTGVFVQSSMTYFINTGHDRKTCIKQPAFTFHNVSFLFLCLLFIQFKCEIKILPFSISGNVSSALEATDVKSFICDFVRLPSLGFNSWINFANATLQQHTAAYGP